MSLFRCWLLPVCYGFRRLFTNKNAAMGVTNRMFAGSAAKVLLTYASAAPEDGQRIVLVGNPVRSAFLRAPATGGRFSRNDNEFVVLAVGGSRGARRSSSGCIDLANQWLPQHPGVRLTFISAATATLKWSGR